MKHFGRDSLAALWITLISALLCYVGYFVFDVSLLGGSLSKRDREADVVNFFYSIENGRQGPIPGDEQVVVFDISECDDPASIAGAVARMAACSPRAVGLDIIFRRTPSVDPAQYDSLERVLRDVPGLVSACRIVAREGEYSVERSFFAESLGVPCGAANSALSGFSPRYVVGADTIPSLALLLSGVELPGLKRRYVNYKNRYFPVVGASEPFADADFRGKTVLVGDVRDLRDFHDLPFELNGSRRVAGVMLLAHGVSTLQRGDWVRKVPDAGCIAIALAVCWLFALGCRRMASLRYAPLLTRLGQVALILLLWFVGYWIFVGADRVVNLVYTMLGVALTGLSMELYELLEHKIRKKNSA